MKSETKGDRVEFRPPKEFYPPEGAKDGEFDMVCSFRVKSDGKICMTKLGDTVMPGYGQEDTDEDVQVDHKPDYSQYASGMMGQLQSPGETTTGGY